MGNNKFLNFDLAKFGTDVNKSAALSKTCY